MDQSQAEPPVFEILLKPHRSLGPKGFIILIALVALVNFGAGLAFWLLGAWPVFAFCGADIVLVWLAFKYSYRQARAREYIRLERDALLVRRTDLHGREKVWRLEPYWLRVECAEDDSAKLRVWTHGKALTLGAFLSPDERRVLARALDEALYRWRQPPGAGLRPLETV